MPSPVIRSRLGAFSGVILGGVGVELYPQTNAASRTVDTNTTTGWAGVNGGTINITTTSYDGTWGLAVRADGVTGASGAVFDLSTILTENASYTLDFYARNDGIATTGTFGVWFNGTTGAGGILLSTWGVGAQVYTNLNNAFTYNVATHRYLQVREASAGNTGGLFVDYISIT